MATNEFAKISKLVSGLIDEYTKTRLACQISENGWHNRSIMRMSRPFIQGYFTLAIVGKVSSGKSTFINALLGTHNLLPTGHDQTTCGITYIEYGKTPEVIVTFGDNTTTRISGADIRNKLMEFVAIPQRYHNLPVNHLDEMILGGLSYPEIEKCKKQLEEKTLCPAIDLSLLKDYVESRSVSNIVKEVRMKYPFNEELKGWRIIDTPGIGAIGGIEDKTKELLIKKENGNKEVDAIIFLQDGSQTLDQSDTAQFVYNTLEEFTDEDKRKLFFVLTHSGDSKFINHKEDNLAKIRQSYGDKINSITYADSLLYLFTNRDNIGDLKYYDEIEKPEIFTEDEWDSICNSLRKAKQYLKEEGDTINHSTMLRIIEEWSNFITLKQEINLFAKNEKEQSLHQLISLIQEDMAGFKKKLQAKAETAKKGEAGISEKKKELAQQRSTLSEKKEKADREINKEWVIQQFGFVESKIRDLSNIQSVSRVRTAINDLQNKIEETEKGIFDSIKTKYKGFFNMTDSDLIQVGSVDWDEIEREAEKEIDKNDYLVSKETTKHHTCKENERIPAKYDTEKMERDKVRGFIALAIKQAKKLSDKFKNDICSKIDMISIELGQELGRILSEAEKELEDMEKQLSEKASLLADLQNSIDFISEAEIKCNQMIEDYGR